MKCKCKGKKNWLVGTLASYTLIYYFLLVLSGGGTDLWIDALVLLVLGGLAVMFCPLCMGCCKGKCGGRSCKKCGGNKCGKCGACKSCAGEKDEDDEKDDD